MRGRGESVGVVDFGSREVRVLVAHKEENGPIRIVGHGVAPGRGCVSQGVVQDVGAAQVALRQALTAAEKESRTHLPSLFCGVHGRNVETFIREAKIKLDSGVVDAVHMRDAVEQASREIEAPGKTVTTSITAREWYVDDLRVIDPLAIRGQMLRIRVHFARMPAVILDNLVSCIESQRRTLEDVVFLPIAAALGCLTLEDRELGIGVLDMGHATTGLAVYRDRRILDTHCFEWGGNHITRDVAAGLQINFEEAEELILQYGISDALIHAEGDGDAIPEAPILPPSHRAPIKLRGVVRGAPAVVERAQLDEIVYERAKELFIRVRQYLNSKGLRDKLVRGIVLTGGAGLLPNITVLAQSIFDVPCRLGLPDAVEILPHTVSAPQFSAAAGVVQHAFEYRAAVRDGRIEGRITSGHRVRRFIHNVRKYIF